jgi:hypothetical protein
MKLLKQTTTPDSLLARIKQNPEAVKLAAGSVPLEVLLDPSTTVLDPAMGGGHYLAEILNLRLQAGISLKEASRTLYGCETSLVYINHARWKLNLQEANLAIMKMPQLRELGMEFRVILANPPYQDSTNKLKAVKLWPKFIETSLQLVEEGGYISMITPSSWMTSRTGNGKKVRESLTNGFDLISVDTSADSFFKVSVDIAQWFGRKGEYSGQTSVDGKLHDMRQVYSSEEDTKLYEIFEKVLSERVVKLPLKYTNTHLKKGDITEEGKYEVHFSGPSVSRTDVDLKDAGVPKLVAPWSCSYKKVFHTVNPTGIFNCWMPCPEEEFDAYKKIWNLKVVRLMCERYKKTCGFTPAVEYGLIPDFRGMTDRDTYDLLGLTKDQVNLVEDLVK